MRRRRKETGGGGGDSWLNTYADMVTLLLTFFVMLFAMSSIDAEKFKILVEAFGSKGESNQIVLVPVDLGEGLVADKDDGLLFPDEALEEMPDSGGTIESFIRSKMKSSHLDKSEARKIADALCRKGFLWDDISAVLQKYSEEH